MADTYSTLSPTERLVLDAIDALAIPARPLEMLAYVRARLHPPVRWVFGLGLLHDVLGRLCGRGFIAYDLPRAEYDHPQRRCYRRLTL